MARFIKYQLFGLSEIKSINWDLILN